MIFEFLALVILQTLEADTLLPNGVWMKFKQQMWPALFIQTLIRPAGIQGDAKCRINYKWKSVI